MPALFRRKIQGTEKGKKERREAAFRLDKSINLPTQGEGICRIWRGSPKRG
nr:MAG TPA: hypothetical protein [Caudoviricetes sp.]